MRNRPRILQIITKADVGGAQQHVLQILRGLGDQVEFILLTGERDYLTRQAEALGVRVEICPELVRPIRPWRDLVALVKIFLMIRKWQPDLVHLHSFKAGMLGRIAARLAGRNSLFTAHGWSFTPGVPMPRRLIGLALEWMLCRVGNATLTISRHDHELAERWSIGRADRRFLVLNAADEVAASRQVGRDIHHLVTVGRLTPVKNQGMLIEVLSRLPEHVTLTVIGEGVERGRLERLSRELDVENRVRLLGEVTDLHLVLGTADLFVLSSDFEGLPLSILEAMSAGLPVVATRVGGVPEAVIHEKTGLVSPRKDVGQFVANVRRLLDDPDLARKMGHAGRERYHEWFRVDRFTAEMAGVYQELLPALARR